MRRLRQAAKLLLLLGLLVGVAAAVFFGPYAVRVQHLRADSTAGYHADFYLYVSPKARELAQRQAPVYLLVQPNNSGTTSDDPGVHQRDAWMMGFERHRLANELGVVLLVPAFIRPATGWQVYTHALDRDVLTTERVELRRLDLQLLAMVERARQELASSGIRVEPKFLLQGFSASGMFANRFTALHPDVVQAVAAGSPGGWPIAPVATVQGESLPYPAGVGDLESLIGAPFDSAEYAAVPQLIVMGALDDNDGLDFGDGWDSVAASQVDRLFGADPLSRWEPSQRAYQSAGAKAQFILVPGIGHERKALQHLSTAFFAELLSRPARQ